MSQSPGNDNGPDDGIEDAEVVDSTELAVPATPTHDFTLPEPPAMDYTLDGTPTFDYVRDRIEGRIATSIGMAELTGDTPAATNVEDQFAAREQAGKDRLEQIRRAMRKD